MQAECTLKLAFCSVATAMASLGARTALSQWFLSFQQTAPSQGSEAQSPASCKHTGTCPSWALQGSPSSPDPLRAARQRGGHSHAVSSPASAKPAASLTSTAAGTSALSPVLGQAEGICHASIKSLCVFNQQKHCSSYNKTIGFQTDQLPPDTRSSLLKGISARSYRSPLPILLQSCLLEA